LSDFDQFREMAEGHALGALDAEERAAFEAHLAAGCPGCEKALAEARWLVSQLAYLAPETAPSQALKERLMRSVLAESRVVPLAPAKKSAIPFWLWAGVAALLMLTLYATWNTRQLSQQVKQMQEQAAAEVQKREKLEQELAASRQEAQMRAILTNPESTRIMLMPSKRELPSLEAKWHSQLGLVVTGYQVPKLSGNRVLQLWLIPKDSGAKPMPSITFWPERDGKLAKLVANPQESMPEVKALAITEEPEGGSEQPTSPVIWVGAVS
jgi:anti-sigma-K factor RskA